MPDDVPSEYSTGLGRLETGAGDQEQPARPASIKPPKTGDTVVPVSDFRMIGGLILGKPLGEGVQGTVYQASVKDNPVLDQLAVKLIRHNHHLSDGTVATLAGTRDTNSFKIRHAGIVPVLAAGMSEQHGVYLLSELIPGVNLAKWMTVHKRALDPRQAAEVIARMADALEAVHQGGLVHCDICPRNLIGCVEDSAEIDPTQIRICDFGLSQPPAPASPVRRAADGSPPYMPPERLCGETVAPGDVFSLGMTLFFLIGGTIPTVADPWIHVVRSAISQSHTFRTPLSPDVERKYAAVLDQVRVAVGNWGDGSVLAIRVLRAIILRCLAANWQDRYRSAADLRDDLRRWLADRPTRDSGYPYTRRETRDLFYRRCRRDDKEFTPDRARLWGWCAIILIPFTLLLAWGGSIAVALGADPDTTPQVTGLAYVLGAVVPVLLYACRCTRWRGASGQLVRSIMSYAAGVFIVQFLVLGHDVITLTQVIWVFAAYSIYQIGLVDTVWDWAKYLGIAAYILSPVVIWTLQNYPEQMKPWCAGLISLLYAAGYVLIAGRHLKAADRQEQGDEIRA